MVAAVAAVVAAEGGIHEQVLPEAVRGAPVVVDDLLADLLALADRAEAQVSISSPV